MADPAVLAQSKRHQETVELTALRRFDADILEKAHKCKHVCVYEFQEGKWEKVGVEGPCFVVKRATQPLRTVAVLNRLGVTNFGVGISALSSIQDAGKIAIFRPNSSEPSAFGFWVPDEGDRRDLVAAIERSIREEATPASAATLAPALQALFAMAEADSRGGAGGVGNAVAFEAEASPAPAASPPATPVALAVAEAAASASSSAASTSAAAAASADGARAQALLLTKRQLQATLVRLLQDERFVDFLHKEYLETARRAQQEPPQR